MEFKINDNDKITMTHTGLLPGKSGKVIHVCFERKTDDRNDYAEIILPSSLSSSCISKSRKRALSETQNRSTMI